MAYMDTIINAFNADFYDIGIPFIQGMILKFSKNSEDGLSRNNVLMRIGEKEKTLPLSFGPYKTFEYIEDSIEGLRELDIEIKIQDAAEKLSDEQRVQITEKYIKNLRHCMKFLFNRGFEFKKQLIEETYNEFDSEFLKTYHNSLDEMIERNVDGRDKTKNMMCWYNLPLVFRKEIESESFMERLKSKIPVSTKKFRRELVESIDSAYFSWNVLEKLFSEYYMNLKNDSQYLANSKNKHYSLELSEKTKVLSENYNDIAKKFFFFNMKMNPFFQDLKSAYQEKYDEPAGIKDLDEKINFACKRMTDNSFILPPNCAHIDPEELKKLYADEEIPLLD